MKPEKVPTELLRHPVADYLSASPFDGDESEVAMHGVEIVRVRKAVSCTLGIAMLGDDRRGGNEHPAGSVMWRESGLIDGSFQRNFCCLPHIAIAIDFGESGEHDPNQYTCAQAQAHVPELDSEDDAWPGSLV